MTTKSPKKQKKWRRDVHVPGIPFTWDTHLSDAEIKEIYAILLRKRFFVRPPLAEGPKPLKNGGAGGALLANLGEAELGDWKCTIWGFGEKISVLCLTQDEWDQCETGMLEDEWEWPEDYLIGQMEDVITKAVREGDRLIDQKKYDEAQKLLRAADDFQLRLGSELRSKLVPLYISLPMTRLFDLYRKSDNRETGLAYLIELQERTKDYHKINVMVNRELTGYASYYFRRAGDIDTAERIFKMAIKYYPGDKRQYKSLAEMYESLERYDDAIAVYELAIKHGLEDTTTKTGFEGKIKRLSKKIK